MIDRFLFDGFKYYKLSPNKKIGFNHIVRNYA